MLSTNLMALLHPMLSSAENFKELRSHAATSLALMSVSLCGPHGAAKPSRSLL